MQHLSRIGRHVDAIKRKVAFTKLAESLLVLRESLGWRAPNPRA